MLLIFIKWIKIGRLVSFSDANKINNGVSINLTNIFKLKKKKKKKKKKKNKKKKKKKKKKWTF